MAAFIRVDVVHENNETITPALVNLAHVEMLCPHWSSGTTIVFHGDRQSLRVTTSMDKLVSALYATNGGILIKDVRS